MRQIVEERLMPPKTSCKVWLAVSLLVALSACVPSRNVAPTPTPLPPPVSYEKNLFTVERGPIVSQFTLTGQVLPVKQDRLFFRASGYVNRVLVQTGDEVKEGQLLAELQVDDLLKGLEQARIDFEVAEAKSADDEKARQYAIAQAEHQVAVRQLQVDLARAALAQESEMSSEQAELSLATAEEQWARLRASKADYDAAVVVASINLTRAQQIVAESQVEYQEALDRPWEPEEVRDRYARALQQAKWDHEIAQAHYKQALAAKEVYHHDLKIQELAVAQAKAALTESQEPDTTTLELQLRLAEENLALAQLDLQQASEEISLYQKQAVERARLTVERLEAQLAERQIFAPYDGVILPRIGRSIREGDEVRAFQLAFVIGDPAELVIGVQRSQERINEVETDTEIRMSLSFDATESYDARLMPSFYPLRSGLGEGESVSQDRIYFSMLSPPEREQILVGNTVYLTVVLGRKDNALLLPPAAIRSFRGRDFVIVQEGERRRRVDVTIGLKSEDIDTGIERVEVIGDLQEGDQVVGP
jgi:HlyD family secretion protein